MSISEIANEFIKTLNSLQFYENSVIVYDIDDTLIDTSGKTIEPIINTYHYAKKMGIATVIITARPGTRENIEKTKEQLSQHGITGYKYMYFIPRDKQDPMTFKYIARRNLHERGYNVAMSIGDMPWDIGYYGGIGFQVPK